MGLIPKKPKGPTLEQELASQGKQLTSTGREFADRSGGGSFGGQILTRALFGLAGLDRSKRPKNFTGEIHRTLESLISPLGGNRKVTASNTGRLFGKQSGTGRKKRKPSSSFQVRGFGTPTLGKPALLG